MWTWKHMDLSRSHGQSGEQQRCEQTVRPVYRIAEDDKPCQHDDQGSEKDHAVQTKPVVDSCQNHL